MGNSVVVSTCVLRRLTSGVRGSAHEFVRLLERWVMLKLLVGGLCNACGTCLRVTGTAAGVNSYTLLSPR